MNIIKNINLDKIVGKTAKKRQFSRPTAEGRKLTATTFTVRHVNHQNLMASASSKPCVFFAQGNCRNGSDCRFSHSTADSSPVVSHAPSPPVMINIPPGQPVFSMDVECVATGVQHNARSVAQVALVDEWSRPVFNAYIKQDAPVSSYIYELTGLTEQILNQYGLPLGKVMAWCTYLYIM